MATSRTGTAEHKQFRVRVLARDRGAGITHCPLCAVRLDYDVSRKPNSAEPDHIVPFSLGGTNTVENGRTICRQCNQQRGANVGKAPEPRPSVITNLVAW